METLLDKKKLLDFMTSRFNKLNDQAVKDFTGDMQPRIHELREVKYWKEAIERGEFDADCGTEKSEEKKVPVDEKASEATRYSWF